MPETYVGFELFKMMTSTNGAPPEKY